MKKTILAAGLVIVMTSGVLAEDAPSPIIDLSTSNNHNIVEEEYQSVRPGALDEKFVRANRTGNTEITLSYEDEEEEKDEYGIVRDKPFQRNDHSQPAQAD